jgi:hypothetical protein
VMVVEVVVVMVVEEVVVVMVVEVEVVVVVVVVVKVILPVHCQYFTWSKHAVRLPQHADDVVHVVQQHAAAKRQLNATHQPTSAAQPHLQTTTSVLPSAYGS